MSLLGDDNDDEDDDDADDDEADDTETADVSTAAVESGLAVGRERAFGVDGPSN